MASVITLAFEHWKAQEAASGKPVLLNEFVFANVPNLDPTKPIDRNEKLPAANQIVHRQAVNKAGLASENAVAYSVTLGAEIGNFDFNWIGLLNKESGTVAMITHAPTQKKLKTQSGQQGNVLTRSFLLEFNGAALETQITTKAETWQIDFTARLTGIDEMQRLISIDFFGEAAFYSDGFEVTRSAEQYTVKKGLAYIGGLRGLLEQNQILNGLRTTKVYADFSYQGNIVSQWRTAIKITAATTLKNYIDSAGFSHYVFAIAEIDSAGNVKDLRPKGGLSDQNLEALANQIKLDLSEKIDKTAVKQTLGTSTTDIMSQKSVTDELEKKQNSGDFATNAALNDGLDKKQNVGEYVTINEVDASVIKSSKSGGVVFDDFAMQDYQMPALNVLSDRICSIVVIGDSITTGVGVNKHEDSYISKFYKSVWNNNNKGFGQNYGFGHESYINFEQALREPGITSSGTISRTGVVMSRLILDNDKYIEISAREIMCVGIVYDAEKTTGDIDIYYNDELIKSVITEKTTGLKNTALINVKNGELTSLQDKCKIVAKNGDITVTALLTYKHNIKNSNDSFVQSPTGFVVAKSGWAYQDFIAPAKLDEIAYYLNMYRASTSKLLVLNLGTNNIYNHVTAKTADEYIALLDQFIKGIRERAGSVRFLVSVPAKTDEKKFPALKGLYYDYVVKILKYCSENNHQVMRLDRTIMTLSSKFYEDGIHPNKEGHQFLARKMCETLGILYDTYVRNGQDDPELLEIKKRLNTIQIPQRTDVLDYFKGKDTGAYESGGNVTNAPAGAWFDYVWINHGNSKTHGSLTCKSSSGDEYTNTLAGNAWAGWRKSINEHSLADDIAPHLFASSQSLVDVTVSRESNVEYTNQSKLPISIYVTSKSRNGTNGIELYIDNKLVQRNGINTGSGSNNSSLFAIIPAMEAYKIIAVSGIERFWEYK